MEEKVRSIQRAVSVRGRIGDLGRGKPYFSSHWRDAAPIPPAAPPQRITQNDYTMVHNTIVLQRMKAIESLCMAFLGLRSAKSDDLRRVISSPKLYPMRVEHQNGVPIIRYTIREKCCSLPGRGPLLNQPMPRQRGVTPRPSWGWILPSIGLRAIQRERGTNPSRVRVIGLPSPPR